MRNKIKIIIIIIVGKLIGVKYSGYFYFSYDKEFRNSPSLEVH